MSAWVRSPRLWATAMDRAAKELPRWTAAFWRKTLEVYHKAGGRLIENDRTVGEDTIDVLDGVD